MGMMKEFKEFALKGNVIDLAVAVVIGAAFGAIISSMVEDVITPLAANAGAGGGQLNRPGSTNVGRRKVR